MTQSFDVCIRGDGIVGRTLALLLARERLRVAVVRQPPRVQPLHSADGQSDVRAYALNSASRQCLQALRAWPDAQHATPVLGMQVHGDDGGQLDFSAAALGEPALAWIVDVPALEKQLAEAVRFQPHIETVEQAVAAPLTVVCEGKKSSSRDEFGAQWTIKPYPQTAVAARVRCKRGHAGVARQWFNGGEIAALLPLDGEAGNSAALVWSVSAQRAAELVALPADAFCAALQEVCGAQVEIDSLISERASWPLSLAQATRWCGPGWALAGDAAHTVHPLAGQGLNLGLADVASLAEVLGARESWRALGDEKLLRRYERARKADVAAMALVTDGLHGVFAHTDGKLQVLRNWGMNRLSGSGPLKNWLAKRAAGTTNL